MLISERYKGTSSCDVKCDKCGKKWRGNYYTLRKKETHLCPSCSCKNGWSKKNKLKECNIPSELKPFILKRMDDENIEEYLPKRKQLKIIIKCSKCGTERQSNSYDVLTKKSTLCNSCRQKENWPDIAEKVKIKRNTKEYKEMMSKSMKNSKDWKDTQHLRIKGLKKYWENIRGGKLEELYNDLSLYKKLVYKNTEKTYRKYKNQINPNDLPRGRGQYHLDHKFSILEGFKNKIPVHIISHPVNLQMLTEKENISKDFKCDISKRELFEGVFAHSSGIY